MQKVFTGIGLVVALTLLLSGMANSQQGEDVGAISCYVFQDENGAPVSGAEIFVEGVDSSVTNEKGMVNFVTSPGAYNLHIVKAGLAEAELSSVQVVTGEVTEAIVTMFSDGRPALVSLEVAAHKLQGKQQILDENQPTGELQGAVVDIEKRKPVQGARIFVRGVDVEVKSGKNGKFTLRLPAGIHALSVVHPDFSMQTIDDVQVTADEKQSVDIELTPSSLELDDYTVVAPQIEGGIAELNRERQGSSAVAEVIGAEQIAKSGDSSAAGALKRVTGLTLVGGKYIYVRGMGERYSSTLMNGSTLPSPEPERRVVPLDMFPVDILESVLIQKTYSADLPGEFGGGTIRLRTRGRPEDLTANVSISAGGNTNTTFQKGLKYNGGDWDWLGIDDGTRSLPGAVSKASDGQPLLETDRFSSTGYTASELENYGEMMSNVWTPNKSTVIPDLGLSATVGDCYKIGATPIGFLLSASYDQSWDLSKVKRNYYIVGNEGELELQHSYDFESLTRNVSLGGILDLSTEIAEHHKLKSTTILIRTTDDEARIYEGFNRDVSTDIRVTRLRWIERMLLFQQLSGQHEIAQAHNLLLDWRYTFSLAMRDEPDRREVRYDYESGTERWILSDRPEGNQRVFSELVDYNHDVGLDITVPFAIWLDLEAKAKFGFNFVHRSRTVDTRRFKFQHKGELSTDTDIISQTPEQIFVPENIGNDGFQFEEITRETDNYSASQRIIAGYLMFELPILQSLNLSAGARVEQSVQSVRTFELFNPDKEPVKADLNDVDVLPAATLTWIFYKDMQLRLGYGMTLSRPDFRELSQATFNDVTGGRQIFGNPDLKRATIHNVDFRMEWYPSEMESVSVGFFYKKFTDPIETVVIPSAQLSITYENAKGAQNMGGEVEFRKNFDFAHPKLADLYLAGNFTYIWSRVELGEDSGIQTSNKRPLQGQSPYVANLQIGYDNADWGTNLAVVYNVFGKRIVEVGAQGAPDVLERPYHQLDFVAGQNLGKGFKLSFKAKNLINHLVKFTQGDETTEAFHRGREFSISASWSY